MKVFVDLFRVVIFFEFFYPVGNEQVEDVSDRLAPMHEEGVEDMTNDIVIECFFEFFGEDVVIFIEHCKDLSKDIITICMRTE